MATINAHINNIIFKAKDSNYTICNFDVENQYVDLIAKGKMSIEAGNDYVFTGEFKDDDRYGEYFDVILCEDITMSEGEEIINYLSSKKFTGIGRRSAKKIYDNFKEEALEIIETEPERLKEIGISDNIIDELKSKHKVQNVHLKLYELLTPLSINEYIISNLYDYIDVNSINDFVKILKNNPYYFIDYVYGFSFSIADKIYIFFNSDFKDSYLRISNDIKYFIYERCYDKGDTVMFQNDIIKTYVNKYRITNDQLHDILQEMIDNNDIYVEGDYFINDIFYRNISELATNLSIRNKVGCEEYDDVVLDAHITVLEDEYKINYSEIQRNAIKNAMNSNISIITGGPGTGKTTIIKAIANIFCKINKYENDKLNKVLLCAPTGRAAQRMFETTKFNSQTIHSALRWDPYNGSFAKNEDDNLYQELIIIDEFSMVDLFVANALFKAIRPYAKIIIVGDPAQLESVGPGSILRDLVESDVIKTTKLKDIYRQGEGSSIASLAKEIDLNKKLQLINTNDMSIINRGGNLVDLVKQIVDKSIGVGYTNSDVQVLYPKYKGINGIDNLNATLKPVIIDENINANGTSFQVGDKVMQLKNNYELEIYNGDIGFITKIHNTDAVGSQLAMEVDFGRIKVELSRSDLDEITHAYAISIHKSQGSEFKVIIIPITEESKNMLSKKLIYTAITRAKDKLILIGDMSYLDTGLNLKDYKRKTLLKDYLINGG